MTTVLIVLQALYALVALLMALYSANSLYLLWLYLRAKGTRATGKSAPPARSDMWRGDWPVVTIQLPVYNEHNTLGRLLEAVATLDYPRERLEVQVLDDSTDETSALAAAKVGSLAECGLDIVHLRRPARVGYKAGALGEGLRAARGEFLVLFDADFLPPADFLRRALPPFMDARLGCLQARWTHLNRDATLLTRLQALAIDAHFMVEQNARYASGLFLNFNGSGGVWRRACIEDAGGWQSDTLTEDLDLSYRAQLRGWRIAYLPDLSVPGELPLHMAAFRGQQARWARGSVRAARKLLPRLLRSRFSVRIKLQGFFHLTHYMVHPLIVANLLLAVALSLAGWSKLLPALNWLPWLMLGALGPPLLYLSAPAPEAPTWPERLLLVPALIVLSLGISANNAVAALRGLFAVGPGPFERTPKFGALGRGQGPAGPRYRSAPGLSSLVEALPGCLALAGCAAAGAHAAWGLIPWLGVYALGYAWVAAGARTVSARSPSR